MTALLSTLDPLVGQLRARGYTVVGPTRSGEAIVLAELASAAELPYGWGVEHRTPERTGCAGATTPPRSATAAGPQAWKTFLHPPREPLWSADAATATVTFTAPADGGASGTRSSACARATCGRSRSRTGCWASADSDARRRRDGCSSSR